MKRRFVRTFSLVTLLLGCVAAASGQSGPICSNALVAGEWGYTKTGTIYLPTGAAAPFGSTGTFVLDASGAVAGTQLASVAGSVSGGALYGTFTIEPSCTGVMTVDIYDPSGTLLRSVAMALVVDDMGRELRALVTSLVLASGTPLPAVITGEARRQFMGRGE